MIRTGVIGYGLGGSAFHAPLVSAEPGLALAAVATSKGDAVHAHYPDVAVTTPEALIADPAIDLVVVSTPNDTHYPLAKAALEAAKHVVIDKPFVTDVAQGEELIALAEAKGRVLVPFHNRRWDSDFLTVAGLLERGDLGEVMLFEAHWDRFRPGLVQPWKESLAAGAGQLPDLGTHMIDQALLLFGMPDALSADLAVQREGGAVDDYFDVTLFYGERRVVLSSSRLVAAARPRFGIHGRSGSFVKYGLDPQEATLRAGGRPGEAGYGIEDPAIHGVLTLGEAAGETVISQPGDYRRFYAGVAAAIAEGAPAPVSAQDALTGLRIIAAARESARTGRRVSF